MTRAVLVVATVLMGLSAGLFATFSYAVMPGLRRADDPAMVQAMRGVNIAILNPVFMTVFAGAAVAAAAGLVAAWGTGARTWLVAALVLYVVGAFVVTAVVNVPLNNALEAGTGAPAQLRSAFEDSWVRWNDVRSLLTIAAFACTVVATAMPAATR